MTRPSTGFSQRRGGTQVDPARLWHSPEGGGLELPSPPPALAGGGDSG